MNNFKELTPKNVADLLVGMANEGKKLLILGHRNPDGDCVGSAYALRSIYNFLGGTAFCAFSGKMSDHIKFLADHEEITPEDIKIEDYDAICTVDVASPTQLGDNSHLADRVDFTVDHHESCVPFSDSYRDGNASAAGILIFRIFEELYKMGKIEEDANIYRKIYCAISADTGSFMFSNTDMQTHLIAAGLCSVINSEKSGDTTADLARRIHNSHSLSSLKAKKLCIENLQTAMDGKIAYILIENEDIRKNSLKDEDFGSAVDVPRSLEGTELAFVIKETSKTDEDGKKEYKISTRSNCRINVSSICEKFSGGGHAKAAGGTVYAENGENAKKAVLDAFIEAYNEQ